MESCLVPVFLAIVATLAVVSVAAYVVTRIPK